MNGSSVVRELTRNRKVDAARTNEQITRQRVDKLEFLVERMEPFIFPTEREGWVRIETLFEQIEPLRRGFWGRISWLLRGR